MPRNARCVQSGLTYHVTQRGVDRKDVFFSHGDRTTYLALAALTAADCQIRILAWCLMTNHVHWVIEAGEKHSLATFFRRVHGRYAQYLNARRGRTGHLWQNRFFSCPLGPTHIWRALRYVEANPTRAGLVENNEDYRWSSALPHLCGPSSEAVPLLDWGFWRSVGGSETWNQQMSTIEDIRQVHEMRDCTHAGRPFGDCQFLQQMQQSFNRQWLPIGRPKTKGLVKRQMGTERSASSTLILNGTGSG